MMEMRAARMVRMELTLFYSSVQICFKDLECLYFGVIYIIFIRIIVEKIILSLSFHLLNRSANEIYVP